MASLSLSSFQWWNDAKLLRAQRSRTLAIWK
jgi:hypothetical protein